MQSTTGILMQLPGHCATCSHRQRSLQHYSSVYSHRRSIYVHGNSRPDIFGVVPYSCTQKAFLRRPSEGRLVCDQVQGGAFISARRGRRRKYQIGLSDQNLQRELGAIRNPTLDSFSERIEGFERCPAMHMDMPSHAPIRIPAENRSRTDTNRKTDRQIKAEKFRGYFKRFLF